jgi:CheY-like chemotaxis protein
MEFEKVNMSILFVDDELSIREEFQEFLKLITTNEVYIAVDGLDGIEKYKQFKPDIVYTDNEMPNMNGIDMIVELKKINPNLKFCFVTASHHIEERTSYKMQNLLPMALYFKPVDMMYIVNDLKIIENNMKFKEDISKAN